MNAITINDIHVGDNVIPAGTEFVVTSFLDDLGHSYCDGLIIFSIWNDEFRFI